MEKQKFFAHRSEGGREQAVQEHLKAMAELYTGFAAAFGVRSPHRERESK